MNWSAIWTDIKQRLLKLDNVHYLAWLIVGVLVALTAWIAVQHIFVVAGVGCGVALSIQMLRKILSNPVKEAIALDLAKIEAKAKQDLGVK